MKESHKWIKYKFNLVWSKWNSFMYIYCFVLIYLFIFRNVLHLGYFIWIISFVNFQPFRFWFFFRFCSFFFLFCLCETRILFDILIFLLWCFSITIKLVDRELTFITVLSLRNKKRKNTLHKYTKPLRNVFTYVITLK